MCCFKQTIFAYKFSKACFFASILCITWHAYRLPYRIYSTILRKLFEFLLQFMDFLSFSLYSRSLLSQSLDFNSLTRSYEINSWLLQLFKWTNIVFNSIFRSKHTANIHTHSHNPYMYQMENKRYSLVFDMGLGKWHRVQAENPLLIVLKPFELLPSNMCFPFYFQRKVNNNVNCNHLYSFSCSL